MLEKLPSLKDKINEAAKKIKVVVKTTKKVVKEKAKLKVGSKKPKRK